MDAKGINAALSRQIGRVLIRAERKAGTGEEMEETGHF
jgi:hypothetical protein